MVKKGNRKHSNECQFYITLTNLPSFNKSFVAFGRVVQGFNVIKSIGELNTYLQRSKKKVIIEKCGEFKV